MVNKYSDEELIDILKTFYMNNGRVPMVKDFKNIKPNESTFIKRFGSWSNALKESGLKKIKYKEESYTKEDIIKYLKMFYEEFNKVPTIVDLKRTKGYPSATPIVRIFGNYKQALIESGLFNLRKDKNLFQRNSYTIEQLKILLKQLISDINRIPVYEDINKSENMPHSSTYIRFFGSLNNALESISFDTESERQNQNKLIEKDMIQKFKELSIFLNRTPTVHDVIEYSKQEKCYSLNAYKHHFGNLNYVIKLLNLTTYRNYDKTREEMIDDLKNLSIKLNRTIIQEDVLNSPVMCCVNKYISEFGSWENALNFAGMKFKKAIFYSKNNIKCLSIYELKFVNMLEFFKIEFQKEVPYSNFISVDKNYRFDFVISIDDITYPIEIFGYKNNYKYNQKTEIKKNICEENNIPLIDLYPSDLDTWDLNDIKNTFLQKIKQLNSKIAI